MNEVEFQTFGCILQPIVAIVDGGGLVMSVKITPRFSGITEDDVMAFERRMQVTLPAEYRDFLLMHNGGKPTPDIFYISSEEGEDLVREFLGISNADGDGLSIYQQDYLGRIPSNFLPIATDYFSNLVCLAVKGQDYGSVYFWDHDREVVESEPDYSNVHFLADNFSKFLNGLYDRKTSDPQHE